MALEIKEKNKQTVKSSLNKHLVLNANHSTLEETNNRFARNMLILILGNHLDIYSLINRYKDHIN